MILVESGSYPRTTIRKGVRIACSPGVVIAGVLIDAVPAGDAASLSGATIRVVSPFQSGSGPAVAVTGCQGVASLEGCSLESTGDGVSNFVAGPVLSVDSSTAVLTNCSLTPGMGHPGVKAVQSKLTLSNCGTISSIPGLYYRLLVWYHVRGAAGVLLTGGLLVLNHTSARGSNGLSTDNFHHEGLPGVACTSARGGEIHITGPALIRGGDGGSCATPSFCFSLGADGGAGVSHSGALFVGQGAALVGGAPAGNGTHGPPVSGPSAVQTAIPSLVAGGRAGPGGALAFTAHAPGGTYLYWALSLGAMDQAIAGIRGVLMPRIDATLRLFGPSVMGPGAQLKLNVPVPNDPAVRGMTLFVQTAAFDPASFPLTFFSAAAQGTVY